MFIRILGRIFFLFYICPFLRDVCSMATRMAIKYIHTELKQTQEKDAEDRARSRANHPAGSRFTQK